ncbi:MAG TPA: hypothetical protein PK280_17480 [Planctomycetota bacterium]|nr:hypothetical protein [Planctomycetota bacterium]
MSQEVEKLTSAVGPDGVPQEEPRGGITLASVLTGAALFLALAWCLPHWSLTKSYRLGMGTYLPLEAVSLTLLLMFFNRFGGKLVLIAGTITAALLVPYWHGAVYADTANAAKMLPPLGEGLYKACSGIIEPARQSPWGQTFLVAGGALLAFALGALPGWAASALVPALQRRMVWREFVVVFVLIASGVYSCYSVQFLVGALTVPYKDDNAERNFKKFYRPVPVDQDPENVAGIPSHLGMVPYDPSRFDVVKGGEQAQAAADEEKRALDLFRNGVNKDLPEPHRIEYILAEADAVSLWMKSAGLAQDKAQRLQSALDSARTALLSAADVRSISAAMSAMVKAVDDVQAEKTAADKAANRTPEPITADSKDSRYKGQGRALAEKVRASEKKSFLARWKRPLVWWLSLLGMIMLLQVFLAVMLRRQWTDHEKLMFPHAEVMRALAEGSGAVEKSRRVFSSPLFWIGASLSGVVFLFQGLNFYFPSIPPPDLHNINMSTLISERPWTAMQRTVSLDPYLLGISYLLTSEVSLSIWVFGVLNQALRVACMAMGLPTQDAWAIHGEWANSDALYTGGILVFVLWLAWSARRHIWYVIRRGLGMIPGDSLERSEPMGYPTAFWGFWLCLAGILAWCLLAGLKLWVMGVFLGLYLVLVVLISRLVSEVGLMTAGAGFWPFYPQFVFGWVFGFGQGAGKMIAYKDSWLGAGGTLVPVTLRAASVWSFIWPSMLHVMPLTPLMLTGFKLTESEPRRKRLLTLAMVTFLLAGVAIFLMITMDTTFERGAQNVSLCGDKNTPNWVFNNWLMRDLVNKERMWSFEIFRVGLMIAGAAVMGALLIFRHLFYWWPLHPIGMVAIGVDSVWFCFLVGWLLKRAALAYGGGAFSQRINAFFYGLIVGQFAMAGFWALLGLCGTGCMPPLLVDMG